MKKENGITLIALVITIIVLLILSVVSIDMLTGDNVILTRAGDAKSSTSKAEVMEKVNMELNGQMANAMAGYAFDSEATIKKNLGLDDTNTTIGGYTVSVTLTQATAGKLTDTDKVEIAITDSNSEFTTATGIVSKPAAAEGETAIWKVTPVKAK